MQVMAGALGVLTRSDVAAQSYRDLIMSTSGLVAYYRLGEASGIVATDETGNYNGSYLPNSGGAWTGGTLGETGAIVNDSNTCAEFSGTQHVAFPYLFSESGGAEAWFKVANISSGTQTVLRPTSNVFMMRTGGVGMTFQMLTPSAPAIVGAINDNTWYHGIGTWSYSATTNQTTVKFYLNGALVGTQVVTGAGSTVSTDLNVGGRQVVSEMLTGWIDEVAVYNQALTSAQILAHYNKGAGI